MKNAKNLVMIIAYKWKVRIRLNLRNDNTYDSTRMYTTIWKSTINKIILSFVKLRAILTVSTARTKEARSYLL